MNRRQFMAGLGLASGSLFLPSLRREADAEEPVAPQRLVVMFTQHGVYYDTWRMRRDGLADDAAWSFELPGLTQAELSPALTPLHPFLDRVSVVDGMAMVSGDADTHNILRHEIGQVHALTGSMVELFAGVPMASAPSIDQRIADVIARPDRFRSLEIGVGQPPMSVNYRDRVQLLPFESRPALVFDRLFGLLGAESSPLRLQQGSVLDGVGGRYDALASHLSEDDRHKLELHRDLVRGVEKRVEGLLAAECAVPAAPSTTGDYAADTTTFVQLLTAAFSCDLVRVATLHFGDIPGSVLGHTGADVHNDFAHDIWIDTPAQDVMTAYTSYHCAQLAELLQALDSVPEGGGTMLDNTTVVWVSEIAEGAHSFERWPVVIAGGRGLRLGRYIHYPSDTPFAGWWWDGTKLPSMGVPHQKLLTTVGRSFGVTEADGSPLSAMPVREVSGIDGASIDCTGVLEELLV